MDKLFQKVSMNTDKMYYLDQFCCICMNTSDLKHLFEVDSDGVSHYNKLISSIAEMNFKEMNDQRLICAECCVTLNTVYDFRQMCLRSKTNLITYISQQQTSNHTSGTVKVCHQDIKPELIMVKNRRGSENEGSDSFERSNPQIKFETEIYKENIDFFASIKEECESKDDDSSTHEDATIDHMNNGAHCDVKVEDVEHQTIMADSTEYYKEFNKIEIEDHPLAVVKEEPMSDTETPQDGSTSQADTGSSEEPKGSEETTIGTELTQNTEKDNERLRQCEIYQKSFNNKDSLMNYMQTHSSKTSYVCKVCKKSFNKKSCLTVHMNKHSTERLYECEICKKGFNFKCNLTEHMKKHSNGRSYECELCKKGFYSKNSLILHMKSHSSKRPYECEICKKSYNYKSLLTDHMKTHSSKKPFECEICKKSYSYKSTFTEHIKTHSSEIPYECEICKTGFFRKSNFTAHMIIHSSERPYECEICKKGFNYKWKLTEHLKIHTSEKPYECEICKRGFIHKRNLTVHMNTHSNKMLYECGKCKKGFTNKGNLTRHEKKNSCILHMKQHSDETS